MRRFFPMRCQLHGSTLRRVLDGCAMLLPLARLLLLSLW